MRSRASADRLAAVGDDLGGGLLEPVEPPGAEHHRVAGRGQRLRGGQPDARRRAGDHGGAALGVRFEPGHQRVTTVVGRAAKPRTLTRVHAADALRVDVVVGDAGHQLLEAHARLEAGQRGAEAEVAAEAEAGDLLELALGPVEVVAVGVGEHPLVAVGRADEQHAPARRRGSPSPCSSTSSVVRRASIWLDVS